MFDVLAQHNPHVRMMVINQAGHFHYREYPEEFNRNVINFINLWSD
jgi:pimeloyl-ACP methyl ester carboxylesterase